jgi:hypothetical protein
VEGCGGIYLFQDENDWQALVITVLILLIPVIVEDFLIICETISFSRQTHFHQVI